MIPDTYQVICWCEDPQLHLDLTDRQRDVAALLIKGHRVNHIADLLEIGDGTVRMHIKHLHARVGTRNLHSLALWSWVHRACCLQLADLQMEAALCGHETQGLE